MSRLLLPVALAACASASVLPHLSAAVMPHPPSTVDLEPVKHLSFPIVERRVSPQHGLQRRSDVVTATNDSNVAYMIELQIGTPPASVKVQIDTGSSELWVDPNCLTISDPTNAAFCDTLGTYDPDKSSTSSSVNAGKRLHYGIGSAEIEYYVDSITLAGSNTSTLTNVTFGVAEESTEAAVGIMGVSFGKGVNMDYNNFIDELAEQGVTNGRVFSLVLGTGASNETGRKVNENIENGAVIFGGIDTQKFAGPLVPLEILGPQNNETLLRYWVEMSSLAYTDAKGTFNSITNERVPVVLDSGSTVSIFDRNTVAMLADAFGAKESDGGMWTVDCDAGDKGGILKFMFGVENPAEIQVPFSDFIWRSGNTCYLGVEAAEEGSGVPSLLGDTILRSAYVVFDQDHKNIYMAQAANCGSNVTSLPAGGNFNYTGQCADPKAVGGTGTSGAGLSMPTTQWAAYAAFVGAVAFVLA